MKQQEFLEISGATMIAPMRTDSGQMLGWAMSRNGIDLERNRGGVRTFKSIDSVEAFCFEHGVSEFKTAVRS
ncbi:hypothetical protein MAELSTROM_4 [Pseudoalteromonas phage Maelstrom]|uniref:hypothetical protein n=1 Tax=Pseudoalteromonas phage Maelstrom TaxID=2065202 RepID=UPI000CA0C512|nr:hypothetical protein PP584_gp04 [Pseudoalteromonas phage Maelstrom]AUG84924.1 hypothetical protein MAELSTROM_4 [Pseudoalteromonas phage Maelstrom]